jgi:Galactose oxidase, central domain/Kelch motif
MTRDRDFDRILDEWFADGPSRIADRVVYDALRTIDRTPQSRGALRLPRRIAMIGNARLVAAALAVIAVTAVGVVLLNSSRAQVAAPSPSASFNVSSPSQTERTALPTSSPAPSPSLTPSVSPTPVAAGSGSWTITGSMHHAGGAETATLLQDGRVLVAGGEGQGGRTVASAELYDPATGQWTDTGSMHVARRGHTATLLADGRVLVAGGWNIGSDSRAWVIAELYDPATGTWSETGSMSRGRYGPKAIRLPDGRVLVIGGYISGGGTTRGAELYDPTTGTWSGARSMTAPGAATLLPDGKVLALHGGSAELYDPQNGLWTAMAIPPEAIGDSATTLADGRMLMLGGAGDAFDKAELYDPLAGTWTPTGRPLTGRGPATLLTDGTVLLFGAKGAARYDPGAGTWTAVADPPAPNYWYSDRIAIRLLDGRVLAVQGGSTVLFDPTGTP